MIKPYYSTSRGTIYHCDSRAYLLDVAKEKSVDLIVTSPPFALISKKEYGNENADRYCEWFRPFASGFRRVLKGTGSLVIDIGGVWNAGLPTRSLYHFDLLLMLCREFGFHLAQEHYWWNPAKLASPTTWTSTQRVRVKDAINPVWWLSSTPWPKADNRRVLQPYSDAMNQRIAKGANGISPRRAPSGHAVTRKFAKDNRGSVPPNLLAIANTESNGAYLRYCKSVGVPVHPARFPSQLPEYFIRMLTDPGDHVLDPFGGSCVTGIVAEALDRHWVCCELSKKYLQGAKARFYPVLQRLPKPRAKPYTIFAPCVLPVSEPVSASCGSQAIREE